LRRRPESTACHDFKKFVDTRIDEYRVVAEHARIEFDA